MSILSKTIGGGIGEEAKEVFYEHSPRQWGFEKRPVNLRGKEEEFGTEKRQFNSLFLIFLIFAAKISE